MARRLNFGTYDYTGLSARSPAAYQTCSTRRGDFALSMMQVSFAHRVWSLTARQPYARRTASGESLRGAEQISENRTVCHRSWKLAFRPLAPFHLRKRILPGMGFGIPCSSDYVGASVFTSFW